MKYKHKKSISKTILSLGSCVFLFACQAHTGDSSALKSNTSRIDSALQRAANSAAITGDRQQSLAYLEKIYKRNSSDINAVISYVTALREADYLNQANLVLTPFANDPKSPSAAKTEYAALQLALGNYDLAEQYAKKAVIQNEKDARAFHYLGIALDAREMHVEAERAFRKALDHWQGNPTSIMNNLALNLASQGFFQEAVEILRKAQAISPGKLEIERNLRIVTALQQSEGGNTPKPRGKPSN